jgi:hypothetical protein
MKRSISTFILIVVACALAAGSPIQTNRAGGNSAGSARLIVKRSANFGVDESINLFVDGSKVAVVGRDGRYDAPLAPGNHALSISTSPATFPEGAPKRLAITAEPGKTYTFTAVWSDPERAVLVQN